MAELAFKVRADWEEAIRLRTELSRLRNEMMQVDTSTKEGAARMLALQNEYTKVATSLKGVVDGASEYAIQLKKVAENATRAEDAFKFGRTFDGSKHALRELVKSLQSDLNMIRQQMKDASDGIKKDDALRKTLEAQRDAAKDTLDELNQGIAQFKWDDGSAMGKILDPLNREITATERNITSLREEIINLESAAPDVESIIERPNWQEMARNAIAYNERMSGIDRSTDAGKNEFAELFEKRSKVLSQLGVTRFIKGDGINQDFSEMEKELEKIANGNLGSVEEYLKNLYSEVSLLEKSLSSLESEYEQKESEMVGATTTNTDLEKLKDSAEVAKQKFEEAQQKLDELNNGTAGSKKTEEDLKALGEQAEVVEAKLKGARDRLKDDKYSGNVFQGLTQGVQGLLGAYTAASGVLAQFGADEKDLQKIQTKLQGSMSMLIGLQQVFNALQSESAFRTKVLDKVIIGLSKAYQKVAASSALAAAGLTAGIVAAIAAIAALSVALSKWGKTQKENREHIKNTSSAAADQLALYIQLQKRWKDANGDLEKQNEILKSSKMGQLATDTKNLADAQKLFVDNSPEFIRALINQAEAEIYAEKAKEKAREGVEKLMKAESQQEYLQGEMGWFDKATGGLWSSWVHYRMLKNREAANNLIGGPNSETGQLFQKSAEATSSAKGGGLLDNEEEEAKERNGKLSRMTREQQKARRRAAEDAEIETRQKMIDLMKESSAKELVQLDLNYEKESLARKRQREDRIKQLQEDQKSRWLTDNPNRKEYEFSSSIKELPKEEKEAFDRQTELIRKEYEQRRGELLIGYESIEKQRENLVNRWNETLSQIKDEEIKKKLTVEMEIEVANFDYDSVVERGTVKEAIEALRNKYIAEGKKITDPLQKEVFFAQGGVQIAQMQYGNPMDYSTYEDAIEASQKIYEAKKLELELREDNIGLMNLETEHTQEVLNIEMKFNKDLSLVFGNVANYTKAQLKQTKAIALEYKKVNKDKMSTEDLKSLQNAINAIEDAEFDKEFQAGNDNLLDFVKNLEYRNKLEDQWIDAVAEGNEEEEQRLRILIDQYNEVTSMDKWAVGASLFAKALGEAAGFMKEIAKVTGNADLENAAELINTLQLTVEGFASGGPMNAFITFFSSVITTAVKKIEEAVLAEERFKRRIADTANYVKQLRIENEMAEDGGGIFGSDAKKRIDSMASAMKDIRESMNARDMNSSLFDKALGIRGTIANFTKLIGVDLYDKYGNLNADSLNEVLNTYTALDEASKEWIEDAIADSNNYEKAIESLKSELHSIFGDMSSQLADMTINGLKSGAEIGSYEMKRILGGAVVDLQKQMVEGIYARYLSQYEDEAFKILTSTSENKEEDLVGLYATMIDNMSETVKIASNAAQHLEDVARERGFEMDELTNEEGSRGSYSNISETTGSAIEGRVASLQISSYNKESILTMLNVNIAEMMRQQYEAISVAREIREIQSESYLALVGIRNNTSANLLAVQDIQEKITNIEIKTRNL